MYRYRSESRHNIKIERTLYIEITIEYTSESSKKKSNYRLVKK